MNQFIRFLATGGIAAATNLGVRYFLSEYFQLNLSAAVISAYICGMIVAWGLARIFVFDATSNKIKELSKFASVNLISAFIVWFVTIILAEKIFPYYEFNFHAEDIAHLIGVLSPVVPSYFMHKYFSFSTCPIKQANYLNKFTFIISVLSVIALVGLAGYFFSTIFNLYHPIPYWDHWSTVKLYQKYLDHKVGFKELISFHNEHKIFFPRLFFLADYIFFGGKQIFLVCAIYLINFANAFLIWKQFEVASKNIQAKIVLLGFLLMLSVSPIQAENLHWGFQVQFVGVLFLINLSIYLLNNSEKSLLASISTGVAANFSMANGILVWPFLIMFGLWQKLSKKFMLYLLAAASASIYLFLVGFTASEKIHSPIEAYLFYDFIVHYLTGVFHREYEASPISLHVLCIISVCYIVFKAIFILFFEKNKNMAEARLVIFAGVILATAFITALGRVPEGLPGYASRYMTPAVFYWGIVCCLIVIDIEKCCKSYSAIAACFLSLTFSVIHFSFAVAEYNNWMNVRALKNIGILNYLTKADMPKYYRAALHPQTNRVREWMDFLKEHKLSIFSENAFLTLPKVEGGFKNLPICEGYIDRYKVHKKGSFEYIGWVLLPNGNLPKWLVAANEKGEIYGYGLTELPREDLHNMNMKGFVVMGQNANIDMNIYALEANKPACVLNRRSY